jgi:hypothetical protein
VLLQFWPFALVCAFHSLLILITPITTVWASEVTHSITSNIFISSEILSILVTFCNLKNLEMTL